MTATLRVLSILLIIAVAASAGLAQPGQIGAPGGIQTPAGQAWTFNGDAFFSSGRPWTDVRGKGAKGDNSTDDTAAIQSVLASGGDVYVPCGTYILSSALSITTSDTRFRGAGTCTVLKTSSATADIIDITGNFQSNVYISDMFFSTSVTRTAGYAINFNPTGISGRFFVTNVKIIDPFGGIAVQGTGYGIFIDRLDIANIADNPGAIGVFVNEPNQATDFFLSHAEISSVPNATSSVAINLSGGSGIFIDSVDCILNGLGLYINPSGTVSWGFFTNNVYDTSSKDGINISPKTGGTVKGLNFTQSWTSTNGGGGVIYNGITINAPGGTTVDGIHFLGHRAYNNKQHGIQINGGTNITIDASFFSGNSQSSSGTYHGIAVASGVSGFAIRNTRAGPEAGFPDTQGYGILIAAGTSNNYILTNNDVRGNITGRISNAGTGSTQTVTNNLGFNPQPSSSVTAGASIWTPAADGWADYWTLTTAGGISAWTCNGTAITITAGSSCLLPPGQTISVTWATTAPVFTKVPQ